MRRGVTHWTQHTTATAWTRDAFTRKRKHGHAIIHLICPPSFAKSFIATDWRLATCQRRHLLVCQWIANTWCLGSRGRNKCNFPNNFEQCYPLLWKTGLKSSCTFAKVHDDFSLSVCFCCTDATCCESVPPSTKFITTLHTVTCCILDTLQHSLFKVLLCISTCNQVESSTVHSL